MQRVENYEYEMPSDFEDEEIDEDLAFTAEDKKKYAGWFGEEPDDAEAGAGGSGDEQQQGSRKRARGEFADLDSSEEEEPEDDEDEVGAEGCVCCVQHCWQPVPDV
jgi:U3 small nucleolar RNA-associated protein 14